MWANTLAKQSGAFSGYVAIDPILGSGQLEQSIKHYQDVTIKNKHLHLISSNGEIMQQEGYSLYQHIRDKTESTERVLFDVFATESHQSIYYPALNLGLREFFKDYRKPDKAFISSTDFDYDALLNYFEKRSQKYQVETSNQTIQSAIYDAIFYLVISKNFEKAFTFWPHWQSPYKMYHADRAINFFKRQNDTSAAITFLHHLIQAMPDSIVARDQLASVYGENNQMEKSAENQKLVQEKLIQVLEGTLSQEQEDELNNYGYHLLTQERNQEAIKVFRQITQAAPKSLNAYDSLAEAYTIAGDYPQAMTALQRAIVLAKEQKSDYLSSIQQKLNDLEAKANAH